MLGRISDPLTQAGVPSFAPWFNQQTYFNYHHTAADTFDKVNPRELAEVELGRWRCSLTGSQILSSRSEIAVVWRKLWFRHEGCSCYY